MKGGVDMQLKDITDFQVLIAHNKYKNVLNDPRLPFDLHEAVQLPYQWLFHHYDCDPKLALKKIEKLVDKGYLEYGVNICYAWMTEEGEKYFKELRRKPNG